METIMNQGIAPIGKICMPDHPSRPDPLQGHQSELERGGAMLDSPLYSSKQTFRSARCPFHFSEEFTNTLRDCASQASTKLSDIFVAGFAALLFRYTAQTELSIAMPEPRKGNWYVSRIKIDGDRGFWELLCPIRQISEQVYAQRDLLVELLAKEPSSCRSLPFEVVCSFHGLEMTSPGEESSPPEFGLTLEADKITGKISGVFDYRTDLLEPATVADFRAHFENLLRSAIKDLTMPISRLPILTRLEIARFQHWNETRRDFPRGICVQQLIARQARCNPGKLAIECDSDSMTYSRLDVRSNQLAHYLKARGVAPGMRVCLCVERSCQMVVAILGVLKAGAAYIPIDPAYPRDRVDYMIEHSGANLIVAEQHLAEHVSVHPVWIDKEWPLIERESMEAPAVEIPPDNVAYVIYTSGSTGQPKGIEIEHHSLVNLLFSMQSALRFGADDVMLALSTISFDASVPEMFLPLISGARMRLVKRDVAIDPIRLGRVIEGVTLMQGTPSTWGMLLQAGWTGNPKLSIICEGETVPSELVGKLLPLCAACYNFYGPTETTVCAAGTRLENVDGLVSVGLPFPNTTLYVLNSALQRQPLGVAGELYIGGEGVARGYLGQPELTRRKFIPDLFQPGEPGKRIYATGDLARFRPDGALEILGRIDRQIKIRGFRIEPGEIEKRLREFPAVRECVVVARPEQVLAAYLVADGAPDIGELRTFLAARLPNYLVPSAFVTLEKMPLTPNGKIDHHALPAPDFSAMRSKVHVDAKNLLEHQLTDIFEEILNIHPIGIRDDFFQMGGDSLHAAQLIARLDQMLGKTIPVATLVDGATVEKIANALCIDDSDKGTRNIVAMHARGTKPPIFFFITTMLMAGFTASVWPDG